MYEYIVVVCLLAEGVSWWEAEGSCCQLVSTAPPRHAACCTCTACVTPSPLSWLGRQRLVCSDSLCDSLLTSLLQAQATGNSVYTAAHASSAELSWADSSSVGLTAAGAEQVREDAVLALLGKGSSSWKVRAARRVDRRRKGENFPAIRRAAWSRATCDTGQQRSLASSRALLPTVSSMADAPLCLRSRTCSCGTSSEVNRCARQLSPLTALGLIGWMGHTDGHVA